MIKLTCYGASSHGNCYLLSNNDTTIMLDCGVKHIENKVDVSKIDGILLTHVHGDHTNGIKTLKNYYNKQYYGNKETISMLPVTDNCKHIIEEQEKFDIGSFTIVGFELVHDARCFGFLIKDNISGCKLIYATDTSNISFCKFKDLDYIICESNYSYEWLENKEELDYKDRRLYDTHLPIEDTIEFLLNNININTKQIILTHISSSCNDYMEMQRKVKKEFLSVKVTAIDPHLKEPLEMVLKEDIDIDFD